MVSKCILHSAGHVLANTTQVLLYMWSGTALSHIHARIGSQVAGLVYKHFQRYRVSMCTFMHFLHIAALVFHGVLLGI